MDNSLIGLIGLAGQIYTWLLIASVLISWILPDPSHPVVRVLSRVTEPILSPIRNLLPTMGRMDFSPFIAIVAIQLLVRVLTGMLQ
ncbi:MAG: YggT family protein [SAR324 cluster bacterium]|nr:YggT family protein [SAR324 cluster bacterium]MCH8886122.1 YggT family protein [SAR324 cluster bacterium]